MVRLSPQCYRYVQVLDYAKMILDPLPNNSLLVVKGDLITNSVRYIQVLWSGRYFGWAAGRERFRHIGLR